MWKWGWGACPALIVGEMRRRRARATQASPLITSAIHESRKEIIMAENEDLNGSIRPDHLSMPLPRDVFEQIEQDIQQAGGAWSEPPEYQNAIGRTMFDPPNSEDHTVTVLLSKEDIQ